jgi:transposase
MVNEYRKENGRRDGTNTIDERKEKRERDINSRIVFEIVSNLINCCKSCGL